MAFYIFATSVGGIPLTNLDSNFTLIGSSGVASTLYPTASTSITYGTTGTSHIFTGSLSSPILVTPVLGTPASGTLTNCTFPTLNQNTSGTAGGLSATLVATSGGTGQSTVTTGDLLYGSATNTWSKLADVATGNSLISGGVGVVPSWGKIGLTTHVSGTLPVANGGTNLTTYAVGDIIYASATGTLASLADVATGNAIISGGIGVAPSYGKIGLTTHVSGTLPVANGGTGITALGTGVATALGVNVGTAGAVVVNGGSLGTPSSGILTSATGLPLTTGVTGTLPIANGGTNSTATATAGGIGYGTGTAHAYTAAGTSGQVLTSAGALAPTWTTPTTGTVTSVSGTTGRITSSGGAAPVIDLSSGVATPGTTGSATLIPVVTIDTYGRVTSITTAANPQGTVTSVSGTAPIVSSGGATPAISMAVATSLANGYLSSTDWSTFNGKQAALVSGTNIKTVNSTTLLGSGDVSVGVTSVTGTAPVVSSGGATPAISMAAASTTVSGYLTSTDWNTFNGKQAAGSYVTVGGALGTPSSGTLTNCTFPTLNQNTSGTAAGLSATLAVASGGTGVTSSTGSGSNVLSTSPTLVSPILGTPTSGNLSNCTGVANTAKAWANFGYVASAMSIRSSFNVSSVTRAGAGLYTVNFTAALTDANFSAPCAAARYAYGTVSYGCNAFAQVINSSSVYIITGYEDTLSGQLPIDADSVHFSAFR